MWCVVLNENVVEGRTSSANEYTISKLAHCFGRERGKVKRSVSWHLLSFNLAARGHKSPQSHILELYLPQLESCFLPLDFTQGSASGLTN